jgi:hypothetical protein
MAEGTRDSRICPQTDETKRGAIATRERDDGRTTLGDPLLPRVRHLLSLKTDALLETTSSEVAPY